MIRKLRHSDKKAFIAMAQEFYSSPSVISPIPKKYHQRTFRELMKPWRHYASAYIFELDDTPVGYALLAHTFSQEAGGEVLWLEELYIKPEHRCKGLGREFFAFVEANADKKIKRLRLEVTPENVRAIALYDTMGFKRLPYMQMLKTINLN